MGVVKVKRERGDIIFSWTRERVGKIYSTADGVTAKESVLNESELHRVSESDRESRDLEAHFSSVVMWDSDLVGAA